MTKYPCPVCNKRACDSKKELVLSKFNLKDANFTDLVIKCDKCGNQIAVTVKVKEPHPNQTIIE